MVSRAVRACVRVRARARAYMSCPAGDALLIDRLLARRDRRKLTFYFVAEKRIDFLELVRELFRCVASPPLVLRLPSPLSSASRVR